MESAAWRDEMVFTLYPFVHACYLLSLIQCSTLLRISYRYMTIPFTTTGLPPPVFPSAIYIYIYLCCPCLLGVELSTESREIYQGPDPHKRTIPTLSSNPLPIAPHLRGRAWRSSTPTMPRAWLPSSCIGLAQAPTVILSS